MGDCFSFRFFQKDIKERQSLVIYCEKKVPLVAVSRSIKRDVNNNLTPNHIYLITSDDGGYSFADIQRDKTFTNEFLSYVGNLQEKLTLLHSGTNGELLLENKTVENDINAKQIMQCGALSLFERHHGLIVSNSSYHFVKPSGYHCNSFIRASNLLVSSNEVSFLAISLLPYLKENIKRIYIDTSSIAFLVSVAINLSGKYDKGWPSIESFESYAALNKSYDFVEDDSSLIIISATTSGSLAKKLIEKTHLCNSNIVTLFHLGLPREQIGLFDISLIMPEELESFNESECKFCKYESRIIHIQGEQFLPENPKHELLLIRKKHFSQNRERFFKKFAATGALGWNKIISNNDSEKEHFHIDFSKVIKDRERAFGTNFEKIVKRYVTRDLTDVIYLEDDQSKDFLHEIESVCGKMADQCVKVCSESCIDSLALENCGSIMVVATAVTSGRKLLSISRKLRSLKSSSSIFYFVAFSKMPSEESLSQLSKDLQQGGHTFVVLEKCQLPRIKEQTKTSWNWEYDILHSLSGEDPFGEVDTQLPQMLKSRLGILSSSNPSEDDLFLLTPKGRRLKLRETFAFWSDLGFDDERLRKATQADVYWTIQTILHDLRSSKANHGLSTQYHTTLISPANFDRFNDGVIQACLLRAASPVELDYRVDSTFSRKMTDVIVSIIRNYKDDQGEGVLEFLMALWTGRLKISNEHMVELVKKFNEIDCDSEPMKFIFNRFEQNYTHHLF